LKRLRWIARTLTCPQNQPSDGGALRRDEQNSRRLVPIRRAFEGAGMGVSLGVAGEISETMIAGAVPNSSYTATGIHGTPLYNRIPWLESCSHGCVRLSNDDIEKLHSLLPRPAGTPIDIISDCGG
jgi:hypothetical protein